MLKDASEAEWEFRNVQFVKKLREHFIAGLPTRKAKVNYESILPRFGERPETSH